MGAVYLATDEQLDRKVALKIPVFDTDADPGLLDGFYREARAAASMRHPGLCPVFDVGRIDEQHYIAMAYIDGCSLRDFMQSEEQLPSETVARLVLGIASAMAESHRHNVIHRDLKPANVMIGQNGEPVVMDFGLARRSVEGEERLTHTGTTIGTPAYMSPEQLSGDHEGVGSSSDIYSLGVIFYELLTGQLPFKGNMLTIFHQIVTTEPPPPRNLNDRIDVRLQDLCLRMLSRSPMDRPASMQRVADELSTWIACQDTSGDTIPTASIPSPTRQHVASEGSEKDRRTSLSTSNQQLRNPDRSNLNVRTVSVGATVVLLSCLAFFSSQGKSVPQDENASQRSLVTARASTTAESTAASPPGATPPGITSIHLGEPEPGRQTPASQVGDSTARMARSTESPNNETQKHSQVPAPAPCHLVAEWVLGLGGTITLGDTDVLRISDLPHPPFEIHSIRLHFTGTDLAQNPSLLSAAAETAPWEAMQQLQNLKSVDFRYLRASPNGFRCLGQINTLESVSISFTHVTSDDLVALKRLPNLTVLRLPGDSQQDAGLTDADLEHLTDHRLTELSLYDTRITDEGLAALTRIPTLKLLYLQKTAITDDGLQQLAALKKLETVFINETNVTNAGIADLQAKLPGCDVRRK